MDGHHVGKLRHGEKGWGVEGGVLELGGGLTWRGERIGVAAMEAPGEVAQDALPFLSLTCQHQRLQEGPGGGRGGVGKGGGPGG